MDKSFLITLSHLSCIFTLLGSIYKCDLGLVGDFLRWLLALLNWQGLNSIVTSRFLESDKS